MTDKKFTAEEIKKALECCKNSKNYGDCNECPYAECLNDVGCLEELLTDALALINRYEAELEDLREIVFTDRTEAIKLLKAEAIKEFAERLKYSTCCIPQHHFTYSEVEYHIDRLVKEMTGETKTADTDFPKDYSYGY